MNKNPLHLDVLEYRLADEERGFPAIYYLTQGDLMEFFCRRNCDRFILNGKTYENVGGALEEDRYVIYLEPLAKEAVDGNPASFRKLGIEVRLFSEIGERKEIEFLDCSNHVMVMAYLDNTYFYFEDAEYERVYAELDQDRRTYVLYVRLTGN